MASRKNARTRGRATAKPKGKKKLGWGGRRPGAGRPKGSGKGPSPDSRKNRVAVMFTDAELSKLHALAKKQRIPVATVAYRMIERALKRT